MKDSRHLQQRSTAAVAFLIVIAVADAIAVITAFPYAAYLASPPLDAVEPDLESAWPVLAYGLVALVQLPMFIVTAVFFIRWYHYAYSNVAAITGRPTTHDPKWTGWGFAVPFLNVVRPQQIMRETWDTMVQHWITESGGSAAKVPGDRVNLWWALFVLMSISGYFAARLGWDAASADQELLALRASQVNELISVGAACAAIVLVRNVTRLQRLILDHESSRRAESTVAGV